MSNETSESPQHVPEQKSEDVSFLDSLIALAERKRLLGMIAVGTTILAVIISFLIPNRYTATTVILPPQQNGSTGIALMAQLGNLSPLASLAGGNLSLKNPNDLQIALMKSRTVEDTMIQRFHLMALYHDKKWSDARKDLEKHAAITNGIKDGMIRLSVTDNDPQRAAEMANAYIEEYRKFSSTLAVTEASQRRLFFGQQLAEAQKSLTKAEEALKTTEQKTGLIQLDGQAKAIIEAVAALRAKVAAKEVQIRAMRQFAADQNPDLQLAEQELAGLQAQLRQMSAGPNDASGTLLMPKGSIPQAGLEYVRRLRDVKYYEKIYELLSQQYEIAKIDEAREGSTIQVVDPAVVPDRKAGPPRFLIILLSALGGFLIGTGYILLSARLKAAVSDPDVRPRVQTLILLLRQTTK